MCVVLSVYVCSGSVVMCMSVMCGGECLSLLFSSLTSFAGGAAGGVLLLIAAGVLLYIFVIRKRMSGGTKPSTRSSWAAETRADDGEIGGVGRL